MARPLPPPPPLNGPAIKRRTFFGFPKEGSCKLIRQSISSKSVHYQNSKELWTELEWVYLSQSVIMYEYMYESIEQFQFFVVLIWIGVSLLNHKRT